MGGGGRKRGEGGGKGTEEEVGKEVGVGTEEELCRECRAENIRNDAAGIPSRAHVTRRCYPPRSSLAPAPRALRLENPKTLKRDIPLQTGRGMVPATYFGTIPRAGYLHSTPLHDGPSTKTRFVPLHPYIARGPRRRPLVHPPSVPLVCMLQDPPFLAVSPISHLLSPHFHRLPTSLCFHPRCFSPPTASI